MKIIAFCGAHALAHVSRPLEVIKVLAHRGHTLMTAGTGPYLPVAKAAGWPTVEVPYIDIDRAINAVKAGRFHDMFRKDELAHSVKSELELYEKEQPDCVIVDNRMTACTSAEIAGIPAISIMNAHVSADRLIPFGSILSSVPNWIGRAISWTDRIGTFCENTLWDHWVMAPMHAVRARYGLRKRYSYRMEEGDLTLFPDVPDFTPTRSSPAHAHYVGPLPWRNSLPAPKCLEQLDPSRPCVYFTIGSQGLKVLIEEVAALLAADGLSVVIATGGNTGGSPPFDLPDHVYVEEYVNADELLPHCALVVCHGGNGTLYQALGHGLPVVGIAMHGEQYCGLKRVRQLGLGEGWPWKTVQRRGLKFLLNAVRRVMKDPSYSRNAKRFSHILEEYCGPERSADLIEQFMKRKKQKGTTCLETTGVES